MYFLKKHTHTILLICLFVSFCSYAQEKTKTHIDSLNAVISKAYNYAVKNAQYGEAARLNDSILNEVLKTKDHNLIARTYNNFGIIFRLQNDYETSNYYFNKSLDHVLEIKDSFRIRETYNSIGVSYSVNKKYKEARKIYQKALKYCTSPTDSFIIYYNIAYDLSDLEKYDESLAYIKRALKNPDTEMAKADGYAIMARNYYNLKQYKKAEEYLNKALLIGKKNNSLTTQKDVYDLKVKLFLKLNDYKNAYLYKDSLSIIKDKVLENKETKLYKEIESKYFIQENEEKLKIVKKQKQQQQYYNLFLLLLALALITAAFLLLKNNKQLEKAKKETEILAQAKSKFYAQISHELRTPLYAVIEISKLLLSENPKPQQTDYLESLNFSGNHLLALVNNVLHYNKSEVKKINLNNTYFNLEKIINSIIDTFTYTIRQKGITLNINYDKTIPSYIYSDSLKLSQVLINILSNAIKFTNVGGINFSVREIKKDEEKVTLYFEIQDSGIGIYKSKQEIIFKEYHQDNNANAINNNQAGTGLGLSIALGILKKLDSEIKLESEEDIGSTFSFQLDVEYKEKIDTLNNTLSEDIKDLNGYKILVVDDNKINLIVSKKIVEKNKGICTSASNGEEAIKLVKEQHFDCILMDINMPGINGFEASNQIRVFNKKTPIILLTAVGADEIKEDINNDVINGIISKPFINSIFINEIRSAIQKTQ